MARIQELVEIIACPRGFGTATLTGRFLITSTKEHPDAAWTLLRERCDLQESGACGGGGRVVCGRSVARCESTSTSKSSPAARV
jgi:hypothetical protein